MTFQKKIFFFIFTKWKRCEFYPNFKRPITRLRRGRPGCRRFWVKAQLKGFPMSPGFGCQTDQDRPVFWLEERSHFRVFGPKIQNFEKNFEQKAPYFPYFLYGNFVALCCIWVRVRKSGKTGFFRDPRHFFHFKDPLRNWILHGTEFSKKIFFFIFTK